MATTLNCKIPVLSKGQHIMTSDYGMRTLTVNGKTQTKLHKGVDLVGGGHTLDYVIAFVDGTVKAAKYQSSMGYYVQIDHGNGYVTRYMHMKKGSLTVKAGQTVKKGQVLGYMGATGNVTGAHLHFDICINGEYIDPKPYLKGEKAFAPQVAAAPVKKAYTGTFPTLPARGSLRKGDKGTQVKHLQNFLNWCIPAGLDVDGSFGPKTLSAVKTYQKAYGLAVDGRFGPASLAKAKTIKR